MFGAFLDAAMSIPKMMHAEEMQQDSQEHAFASQLNAQEFSSAQSATQHQRAVADLRAAGLNPILSARYGGNAAASSSAAGAGGGAAQIQSSFTQGELNSAMKENYQADTHLKGKQASLQHLLGNTATVDYQVREQELQTEIENTRRARAEAEISASNAKGRKLEGEIDETRYGELMRYIDRAMEALRGGSSAVQQQRNPVREHRRVR